MRLNTLLKAMIESRYIIVGHYGSPYADVRLKIDYLASTPEMFSQLCKLKGDNPRVKYVDYNNARDCIEITIE